MNMEKDRPTQNGPAGNSTSDQDFCDGCGMPGTAGGPGHSWCLEAAQDAFAFADVPTGVPAEDTPLDDVQDALDIARSLAKHGIPVFAAPPADNAIGFRLPAGWQDSTPDVSQIDKWQPGWALCAVAGHTADVLDTDPRNGGNESAARLRAEGLWPTVYGTAETPSGGTHDLIAPLLCGKGVPADGVDLQGGKEDGTGRGFVFIAPTVRVSKADGIARAYRWTAKPDLERLCAEGPTDTSGQGIVDLLARKHTKPAVQPNTGSTFASSTSGSADLDQHIQELCDELSRAPEGQGNDTAARIAYMVGQYVGAGQLSAQDAAHRLWSAVSWWHWTNPADQNTMLRTITNQVDEGARHPRAWDPPYTSGPDFWDWGTDQISEQAGTGPQDQSVPQQDQRQERPVNLPDEFWSARPVLDHIRQAAYSWGRSADVVFYGVLARLSSLVSPKMQFQSGIGQQGSLNCFVAIVGPSGTGKSASQSVARNLVQVPAHLREDGRYSDDLPIGTGQGLVEAFHGFVEEEVETSNGRTKKKQVKKQVRENMLVYIDEGEALLREAANKSSITLTTLRSAWNSETLGQTNASMETTRRLQAGTYSLGLIVGFQMSTALPLLDDVAGGTPQRFLWCPATDPNIPDRRTGNPGSLDQLLTSPWGHGKAYTVNDESIEFAEEIKDELWAENVAKVRGQLVVGNPLDSHRPLTLCKVASLLAVLDGRRSVTVEDWALAKVVWETSCAVRDNVVAYGQEQAHLVEEQAIKGHVRKALRTLEATEKYEDAKADRNTVRVARWAAKKVEEKGSMTQGALNRALGARDRGHLEDALAYAVERGWLIADEAGAYRLGDSRPQ